MHQDAAADLLRDPHVQRSDGGEGCGGGGGHSLGGGSPREVPGAGDTQQEDAGKDGAAGGKGVYRGGNLKKKVIF